MAGIDVRPYPPPGGKELRERDSKCLDLERKLVERELILLSLIEICLDLDNKFVEHEANFVS